MGKSPQLAQFQQWVDESRRIVFFGGAGVSTESGIPDFRSVDGLYHQQYAYPPETILSHTFFEQDPEEFFRFYRSKMLYPDAQPNAAHRKLAELERAGRLSAVVTQNIDGLHQAAGSARVYELHGSVHRNHCTKCRGVPSAAAWSSPTWSSMRNLWTRRSCWAPFRPSSRPICSSSAGLLWPSTPPRGSSSITGEIVWSLSTRAPPPMTAGPI